MTLFKLRMALEATTGRLNRAMQSTATLFGLAREAIGLCTDAASNVRTAEAPARVQREAGKI